MADGEDQEWVSAGEPTVRPVSFEPIQNGILKLTWPSGAVATLAITSSIAAMKGVSFELPHDGGEAIRTEFTFADCFSEGGDGAWSPFFLQWLANEQGQPHE